jgi:hypothetical protein
LTAVPRSSGERLAFSTLASLALSIEALHTSLLGACFGVLAIVLVALLRNEGLPSRPSLATVVSSLHACGQRKLHHHPC